jgi:MFS family permease
MNFSSIVSVVLVAVVLLLTAGAMMVSHVRAWRAFFRDEALDAEEFDYRRRQYRRRMQTSAMLGILGAAILIGYLLTIWLRSPAFTVIFWIGVILLLFWTCLLALVDIWATKHHFNRQHDHCLVEQAKLRAEIQRMQAFRGNGKDKDPLGDIRPKGQNHHLN